MILGVRSWLSTESGIDVAIVRVLFLLGFLVGGVGLGVYFILWVVKLIFIR